MGNTQAELQGPRGRANSSGAGGPERAIVRKGSFFARNRVKSSSGAVLRGMRKPWVMEDHVRGEEDDEGGAGISRENKFSYSVEVLVRWREREDWKEEGVGLEILSSHCV